MNQPDILIIGCGVTGLTTAVLLSELGYNVTVKTWKMSPDTTSDKAAAFWSPYRTSEDDQTFEWVRSTYLTLEELSHVPETGVSMIDLSKYLPDDQDHTDAWWLKAIPGAQYVSIPPQQLPTGYKAGWRTKVPLMETQIYLPYLLERFRRSGGKVIPGSLVTDIGECLAPEWLVINCTGLGSRTLMQDNSLVPVRGQIAVIHNPAVKNIRVDASVPIYLVPRKDGCIIGGSYEPGEEEEHPDASVIETILQGAPKLFPGLDISHVTRTYAGLRPSRPTVRLEADPLLPGLLHNYGHGGAGFTLSWGCAESIVRLVRSQAEFS